MKNGFKIMDSDMHVREPADLWEKYIEPEWRDRAPKVISSPNRSSAMVLLDGKILKGYSPTYRGGIFDAQHGSWNRTDPIGARVMFTTLDSDGNAASTEVFADGWLDKATGEYLGRPVDVLQMKDGSLLVSDDLAGAIYRISYGG